VITYHASLAAVAPPIDLLCYRAGSLRAETRVDIAEDDAYFGTLRAEYSQGILELFKRLPGPDWIEAADAGGY
jgi:putative proteasome-type protease